MDHGHLIGHCVQVLNAFDVESRAIEEHVNKYLKYQTDLSEDDQVFVVEVFSGCVRYSEVLSVVVGGFYHRDGKTCLRSEHNLYTVMAYLALFRLDELGTGHYRKFVKSQDTNKMYKFLNFALNDKNLRTWMKDEWCKLYDTTFVQTTLLSPILRWLPETDEIVKHLKDKIDAKIKLKRPEYSTTGSRGTVSAGSSISSNSTQTKPFKLTQPRPRSIPIPDPIPKLQRHRPVPKSVYKEPEEVNVMNQIKETNRRKAEERLMEASKIQFACANPEKSEKTKSKINNILQEEDSKLEFNKHKSNPVPHGMLMDNVPFKLNTAAILREGNLYRQREAKELDKLERLEAGARDAFEFNEWQNKMKTMDSNQQLAEIERRRLEGKLSHEEAILAKQNLQKLNRKKVEDMKEEARELMEDFMKQQLKEEERMREMVQRVVDTHENAKEAKVKLQEYKAKIVQQVVEESKELMRQALEEAEREMQQKMELIRQIRAMEAVPVNRHKLVDLSATAGHGLLSEMSIAELNERISLLRIQQNEEEEEKRDDILACKQAKDEALMDALATISRHRTENTKASAVRLETRKKTRNTKPEIKDEKVLELQQKLEAKRAQRLREQEQSKLQPSKKSAQRLRELNQTKMLKYAKKEERKKVMEQNRWQELEMTRERTAQLTSKGLHNSQSASRIAGRTMVSTFS